MDAPNPLTVSRIELDTNDAYADDTAQGVRDIHSAATNPIGTAIGKLIDLSQQGVTEDRKIRLILEEIRKMEAERTRITGFSTSRISYAPGMGVYVVDTSELQKQPPKAFTLVTAQAGPDPATPAGKTIYGSFGRNLIPQMDATGAVTGPPRNFDFLFSVGGKIQAYEIRQGLEAFSIYSGTAFDAILYMTAGQKSELPTF